MSSGNTAGWMWAQACDLLEQAERMHRQFFRLSTAAHAQAQVVWAPPIDMFEADDEVVVVVALPGVASEDIEISTQGGTLVVRARSHAPLAAGRGAVRRLEIPYGLFERRIALPNLRIAEASRELRDGCLILRLHKEV